MRIYFISATGTATINTNRSGSSCIVGTVLIAPYRVKLRTAKTWLQRGHETLFYAWPSWTALSHPPLHLPTKFKCMCVLIHHNRIVNILIISTNYWIKYPHLVVASSDNESLATILCAFNKFPWRWIKLALCERAATDLTDSPRKSTKSFNISQKGPHLIKFKSSKHRVQ